MKKVLRKLLFPLVCVVLLAPWPIAYAYGSPENVAELQDVEIIGAPADMAPSVSAYGGAICAVTPGDLFYINAPTNNADIQVTLYLTNAQELVHDYRYIILQVGVYIQDVNGQWQKASAPNGDLLPEMYISMLDSQMVITLPGLAKYKIAIDSGSVCSFYTISGQENSSQPQFYVTVN